MKILSFYAYDGFAYNFTKEILQEFLNKGNEVIIVCPKGEYIEKLVELGCKHYDISIKRRGLNPLKDLSLYKEYKKILSLIKPDIVLTYTVKPNIYGNLAAKKYNIPVISRVPGLGGIFQKNNLLFKFVRFLYRISIKHAKVVYFENSENEAEFLKRIIVLKNSKVIPGSGVNLDYFKPQGDQPLKTSFLFLGRIMKDKGIEEFLEASIKLKQKYSNDIEIKVAGFYEEHYSDLINGYVNDGLINYLGYVKDSRKYINESSCIVLPSYHEGMSNVMLESQAMQRAVIGSNIPGIRETLVDGVSGFLCNKKDSESLFNSMEKYHLLTYKDKVQMGLNGRLHIQEKFDRNIIVQEYISAVNEVISNE